MEFGFGIHVSEGLDTKVFLLLQEALKSYLSDKHYGDDVKKIVIGICCMSEQFENFYKKRKPKFIPYNEIKVVDKTIIVDRVFEYELWLNFNKFQTSTPEEKRQYLAAEIVRSLENLNALPKKIKEFDKERFRSDMELFLTKSA